MSDIEEIKAGAQATKPIGDVLLRGPDGTDSWRLVLPAVGTGTMPITSREAVLLAIMFFKAATNRDARPLDYWGFIEGHGLQRLFVKVSDEPIPA